jgi:1-deoxy-D-xylulose 5-phosphate reductoisomerase
MNRLFIIGATGTVGRQILSLCRGGGLRVPTLTHNLAWVTK